MKNILKNIKDVVIDGFTNIFEYYKEHWIRFTLIGVTIIIFIILFINSTRQFVVFNDIIHIHNIYNDNCLIDQQLYIYGLSINIWLSFLTIISFLIGGLFALYQYDKNKKQRQQEKGADIAKLFSDKLLLKCSMINEVIKASELYEFMEIDKKDYFCFKEFNVNELRQIYLDDDFPTKYERKFAQSNLNNIYFYLLKRLSNPKEEKLNMDKIPDYKSEDINNIFSNNTTSCFPHGFLDLIDETLNELEYVCMNISSQAAGSKFIYQSLHQIFIRTVRNLAIEISFRNKGNYCDKYYTNIIYVYNEWGSLYLKELNREKKKMERVNKILNPKIKTI